MQKQKNRRSEELPLWLITPSRWQPRSKKFDEDELVELARSIFDNGLINPITVFEYADADGYTVYELVAGERRTRACIALALAGGSLASNDEIEQYAHKLANIGLTGLGDGVYTQMFKDMQATIPAHVEDGDNLQRLHVIAVIENLNRAGLSPIEEARGYQSLSEAYGWSQRELARRVHKSQGYVAQRLGLLSAAPALQEAVSTRVLSLTTARAVAAVPETLQPAVTTWAVQATQRDESPATTRQVEKRMREIAAFVDPHRWEPNEVHVYSPEQRNRLRLLQWAAEKAAVNGNGTVERLMELTEHGYSGNNLLSRTPVALVKQPSQVEAVLHALLPVTKGQNVKRIWQTYAGQHGVTCEHCLWHQVQVDNPAGFDLPCARLRGENVATCTEYIGPDDPSVLLLKSWELRRLLGDSPYAKAIMESEGIHQAYLTDLGTYVAAVAWAGTRHAEEQQVEQQRQDTRYIEEIQSYSSMPQDWPNAGSSCAGIAWKTRYPVRLNGRRGY